ncbi:hypothetical protein ACHAWF_017200, partial [Thalassiosira exigua]
MAISTQGHSRNVRRSSKEEGGGARVASPQAAGPGTGGHTGRRRSTASAGALLEEDSELARFLFVERSSGPGGRGSDGGSNDDAGGDWNGHDDANFEDDWGNDERARSMGTFQVFCYALALQPKEVQSERVVMNVRCLRHLRDAVPERDLDPLRVGE